MATQAQIEANRRNAKKSTGPKTEAGKARSRMNGLTHGFTTAQAVLDPLEEELFPKFADAITSELRPQGFLELSLVDQIISCAWRLRRVLRLETDHLRSNYAREGRTLGENLFRKDQAHRLFALSSHETRVQRAMHRALQDLMELKKMPKIKESTGRIDWQAGGNEFLSLELVAEKLNWLGEYDSDVDDLIKEKREVQKLRRKAVEIIDLHEDELQRFRQLEALPSSPERDRHWVGSAQRLWKIEAELLSVLEAIDNFREEKNRKANPIPDLEFERQELKKALDATPHEANKANPESQILDAEDELPTRALADEDEPPIPNSTTHPGDRAPSKKHSVAADFNLPWTSISETPGVTCDSPSLAIADPHPKSRSDQDTRHKTQDISLTHKPQDTPLNEKQAAALAQLRKYQLRLHETCRLENGPEKNKLLYLHHKLLEEYKARNEDNLSGVPKDLITFNPARDLPAP